LPSAASWKLAHQLYVNYFWDKQTYKLKSNLSGEELLFTSYEEVIMYLNKLGYNVGSNEVRAAFNRRSESFCNHKFYKDEKKEITYFE
jgi:hypothetical protein